jgi:NAD+ synthase
MSLLLTDPQKVFDQLVKFTKKTFTENGKQHAVIAVSGGIDSALSLSVLRAALPKNQITALLLPYADQSTQDAELICSFHQLVPENIHTFNIAPIVDEAVALGLATGNYAQYRKGNLMARSRMLVVYDFARSLDALVCGTENKSEHYLGYFTRFGDAASDLEPISQLYKTQVRQLVSFLNLPTVFLEKPPSAGLWQGQTDEKEMGFSYQEADQVLVELVDKRMLPEEIVIEGVSPEIVQAVVKQVRVNAFKLEVPYEINENLSVR